MDAETGAVALVDTSSKNVRKAYALNARKLAEERRKMFSSTNVDHIDIRTDKPYIEELIKFFRMRKQRI